MLYLLKKYGKFVAGATALIFILSIAAATVFASDLDELLQKQKELNRRIKENKEKIEQTRKREKSVLSELNLIETQLEEAKLELEKVTQKLIDTENKLKVTERELKEAEQEVREQTGIFRSRIKSMYKYGAIDYLEVLLSATSFSDLVVRFDLIKRILDYDKQVLQKFEHHRAVVQQKKIQLEDQRLEILALKNKITLQKNKIAARAASRERLLQQLRNDRKAYERALDEMEEAQEELNRMIAELQARQKKGYIGTAKFAWPVPGYHRITSGYGWRIHPIIRTRRMHTGIDIAAPIGIKIVAATHGDVIYAGWIRGYGYTVILDHGGGIATMYAHCSKLLARAGQRVYKGQTIALIGSTGLSTGPHLHFEVKINGRHTNPWKWLK